MTNTVKLFSENGGSSGDIDSQINQYANDNNLEPIQISTVLKPYAGGYIEALVLFKSIDTSNKLNQIMQSILDRG